MKMLFYGTVKRLLDLLAGRNQEVNLDQAALELAEVEFPGLAIEPFLGLLDSHAAELSERIIGSISGLDFVTTANRYLFEELGFRGNASNYYDARNSCLNEVLTARAGIPITLSLVYIEIARRLGKPVRGIGLPGHFVVRYDDGVYSTFIDPFNGGQLLTAEECFTLARTASGVELELDSRALEPVSKRQIMFRMINNLRRAYQERGATGKALEILSLLLQANPNSAEEYRQRGLIHLQAEHMTAARADLTRYLELAPEAPDRSHIEEHLRSIQRWLAAIN
ncbi:MAG: transglutaminase family protein [Candidatus Solibacter usitatus]|nr:transglutaminase family protein [Candidatus Solibacter usitatus]